MMACPIGGCQRDEGRRTLTRLSLLLVAVLLLAAAPTRAATFNITGFTENGSGCDAGPAVYTCGTLRSAWASTVEDGTKCPFTMASSVRGVDPQVGGALFDAGGDTDVFTIASTSPARNRVTACAGQTDQRLVVRGTPCDSGAYEYTPQPSITAAPPAYTSDATPEFAFSAASTDFECRLTGPGQSGEFSPCESPWAYDLGTDGDYVFPAPVITAPAEGAVTGPEAIVRGTAEPFAVIRLDDGDSGAGATVANAQGAWSIITHPLTEHEHELSARQTDRAGNVSVPEPGKTVVAAPAGGKVLVKRPGSSRFVKLDATQGIPFGSIVDARKGKVEITAVLGGKTLKARFFDGIFKVTQAATTVDITLTEALASCGKRARAAAKKPKSRKLWGDGSRSFRTRGQYSAATVRGTEWLVQDSCAGTLTRVKKGAVAVRDDVKRRTIVLRAGQMYLAKPRR